MGDYFIFQKLKFNNQNMNLMEIEDIKNKIRHEEYEISSHAEKERYDEDITIPDLENTIFDGEIIEDYSDDPRGQSCLILGHSQNRPIHIVCGYSTLKWIRIITVYIPKPPKWINERTRAKRGNSNA
jgi:hypothetical protein